MKDHSKNGDYYGFIEPDGTIHFVDWGHHEEWSYECASLRFKEEFTKWQNTSDFHRNGRSADFLVLSKGWVLFDSPGYGLFSPTYLIPKITKKQIEAVLELYMDLRFEYPQEEIEEKVNKFLDQVDY